MHIKILGSGGGEGFPASFCSCDHCEAARKAGGKSLRTLSQTLIDGELLIDFPADTNAHCLQFGINLGKLQNVLITHPHEDHFIPDLLRMRGSCYAHKLKYEKIRLYGSSQLETIYDTMDSLYGKAPEIRKNIEFISLSDKQVITVGKYTVTAIKALHAPHLNPLNYIIEDGKTSLLYLLDSGYPTEETLSFLEKRASAFDCVILDGTMGVAPAKSYIYHMGFEENKTLKAELLRRGIANENTRFVVTHITHNQAETHEKIEKIFEGTDILVAYDGFEINV